MAGTRTRQIRRLYSGSGAAAPMAQAGRCRGTRSSRVGGCSLSGQFDSLLRLQRQVRPHRLDHAAAGAKTAAQLPPDADLAYARAAASAVLSRGEKDASLPWENPRTGARGTVTPIASAYTQDGQTCRDFLASYVSGSSQAWLQGEACKQQQGDWEVRSFKPWKRS